MGGIFFAIGGKRQLLRPWTWLLTTMSPAGGRGGYSPGTVALMEPGKSTGSAGGTGIFGNASGTEGDAVVTPPAALLRLCGARGSVVVRLGGIAVQLLDPSLPLARSGVRLIVTDIVARLKSTYDYGREDTADLIPALHDQGFGQPRLFLDAKIGLRLQLCC